MYPAAVRLGVSPSSARCCQGRPATSAPRQHPSAPRQHHVSTAPAPRQHHASTTPAAKGVQHTVGGVCCVEGTRRTCACVNAHMDRLSANPCPRTGVMHGVQPTMHTRTGKHPKRHHAQTASESHGSPQTHSMQATPTWPPWQLPHIFPFGFPVAAAALP